MSSTVTVECPDEVCSNLARATYESKMWSIALDRLIDRNLDDPDVLDSPTFRRLAGRLVESVAEMDMLGSLVASELVPDSAAGRRVLSWEVNMVAETVTFTLGGGPSVRGR